MVDQKQVRKLGSNTLQQTMTSGISAYLNAMIGFGNQVTTNSSACATGTEAILMAYDRIKSGKARRMLAGSTNDHGPYMWGGFDALKVLSFKFNDVPDASAGKRSRNTFQHDVPEPDVNGKHACIGKSSSPPFAA